MFVKRYDNITDDNPVGRSGKRGSGSIRRQVGINHEGYTRNI